MSATTPINWATSTWNPVTGCTPAGEGCKHCYAARLAKRLPVVHGGNEVHVDPSGEAAGEDFGPVPFSRVICHPDRLGIPERWRKPRAIMCPSMGDLFHEDVPNWFRDDVWRVFWDCPQHTFIVLTKRPDIMRTFMLGRRLDNVVLGVSCSTQDEANQAIPILLDTRANRRIVSLEPLVGPVDLECVSKAKNDFSGQKVVLASLSGCMGYPGSMTPCGKRLDGVIVGGETGPGARPMHPDWVRLLRDQCAAAGVPFFFKQWGTGLKKESYPARFFASTAGWDARVPNGGRELDGRTHDELCWDTAGRARA